MEYTNNKVVTLFTGASQKIEENPSAYLLFLAANITLSAVVLKAAYMFTCPVLILPLAVVYALELYFFPVKKLWPLILCMDALCFLLLTQNEHHDITDAYITFFGVFHLSLLLDIKTRPFMITVAAGVVSFLLYKAYVYRFTETIDAFIIWTAFVYWYRSGFYKSVWGRRLLILSIIISAVKLIDACTAQGSDHITDIPLAFQVFLMMVSVGAGIYFNGSLKRVSALLGAIQILFVAYLFYMYPHIAVF